MVHSRVTGKAYDPCTDAIYITNPQQCYKYFSILDTDLFLDIIWTSERRPDALVYVWKRCPETARAKQLWDQHML